MAEGISMRIGILGRSRGWHAGALVDACRRAGHDGTAVDFTSLVGHIKNGQGSLVAGGVDLLTLDRVIVRSVPGGSLEQVIVRVDALHRLQVAGVPVLNPARAIEACVDKYLAAARLAASGVPTPQTAVCERASDALEAFHALGGNVVVKPIFGSEGRGILLVESASLAERAFPALEQVGAVLLLQEFIPNPGWDARVLVGGSVVVAAMRRWRRAGEFRSNITQGGRAEPFDPPSSWVQLALQAAAAVEAPLAGVDLLPTMTGGVVVLEVNSSPGFRALSRTTGVDIASAIVELTVEGRERW